MRAAIRVKSSRMSVLRIELWVPVALNLNVIVITGYPDSEILDRILQVSPVTVQEATKA